LKTEIAKTGSAIPELSNWPGLPHFYSRIHHH
jgi:hypothetical protein